MRTLHTIPRQMITVRFFLLLMSISLTFSIIWLQTDEIQNNTIGESLIEEALKNGARDYRYSEVYRKTDRLPKYFKYVLLWTPKTYAPFYYFKEGQRAFIENNCSQINCYVTGDRDFFKGDLSKFDAIGFNGRSINENNNFDIPNTRFIHQKYIFFNLESADNYPICSDTYNGFFNWTATYRLDSEIPFPYIQIRNQRDEVVGPKLKMDWPDNIYIDKEFDYRQNKTKAVAWFVSHCNSRSGRKLYAKHLQRELMNYGLTLDIYGACGPLNCPRNLNDNCTSVLDRDYFFYLSFENSFAEDYVTEKLLTALQNNVVPIVLGGADYSRFLPPGSYLDALASTPRDLAATINEVMSSPSQYNEFFKWKSVYYYRDPSTSDSVCALCAALNNETFFTTPSYYQDFRSWWYPFYKQRCSITLTIIIPNLKDLKLSRGETFSYVADAYPRISIGPHAFASSDPTVRRVATEFYANLPISVREAFLVEGAFIITTFIQNTLCDFGLDVL